MGVSPISLKKNKCSRHLRPMERSAGNRSNSLANLSETGQGLCRESMKRVQEKERGGGVEEGGGQAVAK